MCGPLVIQVLITKVSSQISSSSHWVSIGTTDLIIGLVALQIFTRDAGTVQLSFDECCVRGYWPGYIAQLAPGCAAESAVNREPARYLEKANIGCGFNT